MSFVLAGLDLDVKLLSSLFIYWLATTDPCVANSPENFLSPLKRLILMMHTTWVILPWSH
jgi:hypothetical protein